ncbi:hypothetical protein [Brachyspira pulli]|uniref:hypothetical protein n=1 Tax=Brachyspira pulli TaxID=310721 RepID=UPI003003BE5C
MKKIILDELKQSILLEINDSDNYNLEATLKETSLSKVKKSDSEEYITTYMTDAENKVINADKLIKKYNSKYNFKVKVSSVDAIYKFTNGNIYLIEFKSGSVSKEDVYKKAYDTYIALLELKLIKNINNSKRRAVYIMVYKEEYFDYNSKIKNSLKEKIDKIRKNKDYYKIGYFEGYLFKESFACTKDDFNKYIVSEFDNEEI